MGMKRRKRPEGRKRGGWWGRTAKRCWHRGATVRRWVAERPPAETGASPFGCVSPLPNPNHLPFRLSLGTALSAARPGPFRLRLAWALSVHAAVAIEKETPENERPESFLRAADDPSSSAFATPPSVRARFERMIWEAQDEVCTAIEAADGGGRFKEDVWSRSGVGSGIRRLLQDGGLWEKAGVNVSVVYGVMPPEAYSAAQG